MTIVGAFILPHGAMILDPKAKDVPKEAIELHKAMLEAANHIAKLKPDIIFMTSPHGIALSEEYGIYVNKSGEGSAEWNGSYQDYKINIDFNQELAIELYEYLIEKETNVSKIATFTPSVDAPLRWGEAVPLWFIRDLKNVQFIYMSQPLKRLENPEELIPETITLGNDLRIFFEQLNKRVIILISADLAHTHLKVGPYGFNELAEPFDALMEEWARKLNRNILLKKAVPLLEEVFCCGFIGFVILQGILEKLNFKSQIIQRSTPTYYGMMVTSYLKD
ncbi:MAG: hypothetical protein JXA54_08005 [Candidatus Heimdallarchaeota archaeon]|nr:hypothetical protein [Candidatus Heimdallarchaeota archaeon]